MSRGSKLWQKGGPSPNPGGRPAKHKAVRDFCADASEEMAQICADLARDIEAQAKDRIAAAKVVLEYGLGKPTQFVEKTLRTIAAEERPRMVAEFARALAQNDPDAFREAVKELH